MTVIYEDFPPCLFFPMYNVANLKFFHEEDLSERDKREDGNVVGYADDADEPELSRESRDVTKVDGVLARGADSEQS